jgi:BioD-like phosphotransacetylase family protein
VASQVHNLIVKTHAVDTEKISVIRDLIATHVDVNKILRALKL